MRGEIRRVHPPGAGGQGDRFAGDGEDDRGEPDLLSKVERDEFPPPAEDKVKAIAKIIECDADDLLARAGRVSSDIVRHHQAPSG